MHGSVRTPVTTPPRPPPRDLTGIVLAIVAFGLLMAATFMVMRPFLPALIWSTMVVVATWPLLLALERRFGGRRWLAATLMTLIILVIIVGPVGVAVGTIAERGGDIAAWAKDLAGRSLPPPPEWVGRIPFVGERAAGEWQHLSSLGMAPLVERLQPYAGRVGTWIVSEVGSAGVLLVHLLLTIALAAILYLHGDRAASGALRFARRLAGDRGYHTVALAGAAIRAVALGIVVTALTQSVLGGVGLAIAGIPFAGLLTAVMFIFCIAQLGPVLVLAPAVIWLYWTDLPGWGTFLLVWTVIVGSLDNFLRPLLIRRGADLPLLLIMAGVIGGLLAFGVVGLFIGPVVLAVSYTLLNAWVDEAPPSDDAPGSGAV
jgi:predicted PurR-regulated permease PerM